MYKTLIRPVVLYGHETWTLLAEDERALEVFERKMLRTIHGGIQDAKGEWRRRMNHELHALLGEPNIVQTVRIERLWSHVWMWAVKEDLKQITNLGDWREAAQDRGRWRNLLATASARRVAD